MIVGEKKMIKILSDSTCDLSKELVQRYNIGIIPLYVRLAAQELGMSDRVHVIDSANLSTGVGLLVVYAAELAKEGKAAKEIVEEIENTRDKVRASFVIDTLVYLHRGGRCSGLAAFFGTALKIHPRIAVTDGAMHPDESEFLIFITGFHWLIGNITCFRKNYG